MARRIELKGIANALNGSFISRNNDFKGYWSIGQLKLFAYDSGITSIKFSLTKPKTDTISNLQNNIAHHYNIMLGKILSKQKIPESWIREATITIKFNANIENAQLHDFSPLGEPFQCCCQIIDDSGRYYISIVYGRCRAHSVAEELKSTRTLMV